jgi:hypothetical protein
VRRDRRDRTFSDVRADFPAALRGGQIVIHNILEIIHDACLGVNQSAVPMCRARPAFTRYVLHGKGGVISLG